MAAPRKTTVEDEDLDDLDDVLEHFSAPPKPAPAPAPSSSATTASASALPPSSSSASASAPSTSQPPQKAPSRSDPFGLDGIGDDFARELTKGMEDLFRDIAQGAGIDGLDFPSDAAPTADAAADPAEAKRREDAFKAAWEAMLVESMNGTLDPEDLAGAGAGTGAGREAKSKATATAKGKEAGAPGQQESFQDHIKKTMDKLKESDHKADEAASQGGGGLEDLFAQLGGGDLDGDESEEQLKGILESMMSQLMSKDVLYEPLKELHDKFPSYLEDHANTLSAEDKTRYAAQSKVVAQIVAAFEAPNYSDGDPAQGLHIVELMQEMQEFGSPPSEIMGPLPPGLDLGPDGLPKLPDGCTIA